MININLFGGPGAGKSATAAGLFHTMKLNHYNVEYIQEFAKDLTYGKDQVKLRDQIYIFGKQHHKTFRLRDQVDYIIHDSPFLLSLAYVQEDGHLDTELFGELVVNTFNSYNNINILLERNPDVEFQTYGRNQDLEGSIEKDKDIKILLDKNNIDYITLKVGPSIVEDIINIIRIS